MSHDNESPLPTLGDVANAADRRFLAVMVAGLVAAAAVLGCMGPDELELEQQQYCNNVRDGIWPDYERGRFKSECGGEDPPKFREDLTK